MSASSTRGVLWKKLFLKISQYSQKNTCIGVFFDKAADQAYFKEHLQTAAYDLGN